MTVVTPFEQLETPDRFDVVFAAAAWHWTDPATRWARAAELLVPGGVLALFGTPAELADPVLAAALHEIEQQVLAHDDATVIHPWLLEEMAAADGLTKRSPAQDPGRFGAKPSGASFRCSPGCPGDVDGRSVCSSSAQPGSSDGRTSICAARPLRSVADCARARPRPGTSVRGGPLRTTDPHPP